MSLVIPQVNTAFVPLVPEHQLVEYFVRCLYRLARTWHDRGERTAAEAIYRLIVEINEKHPITGCQELILSMHNLSELFGESGRTNEAELAYLRTIRVCVDQLGTRHPVLAIVLRSYGQFLRTTHKRTQAANVESRATAILRTCLPDGGMAPEASS